MLGAVDGEYQEPLLEPAKDGGADQISGVLNKPAFSHQ